MAHPVSADPSDTDRIVVVAAPSRALDLLRLAVLRSDDVFFVAEAVSPEAERYASRFAVETARRAFAPEDLSGATALLLALPDAEDENRILRSARRQGIPVHVVDRPLVSDFSVLALLEHADARPVAA